VDWIITDVESGLSNEREGMNKLLTLIDSRQVTEVVATRVDRLGRDASATDSLIILAGRRGVTITTLDGGTVETETPTGFLMARLSTSLAEMESKMLSLRIKRGLEQRRKTHKPCRGKAPWGYQISKDKSRIERNFATWDAAMQFLHILRENNWRMSTALEQAGENCPLNSVKSVHGWINNPILRGGIGYRKQKDKTYAEIAWDLHEPLISHEEYRLIQIKMEQNRRQWGSNTDRKPKILTGLCWCPNCNKKTAYAGSRKTEAIICTTRDCVSRYKGTRESVIIKEVNKALAAKAEQLGQHISEEPPEAAALRDQIDRLQKLNDPDLEEAIAAKQQKLRNLMATSSPTDRERVAALAQPDAWEMATQDELRLIYLEFVSRIEADRGQVVSVTLKI
jgi:DNA invertase Pin-like site-specific DNA recombinase